MAHKDELGTTSGSDTSREYVFDYKVLDQNGHKIGTVNDLWPNLDGTGYSFVGVHTGWLIGKNHVVPADGMEIDHEERTVRLPLSADAIKAAPDFDVSDEIVAVDRDRISSYYGGAGGSSDTTESTETPSTTRTDATTDSVVDVPIREEKVVVGKREVESGNVRLRRIVRTETVNVPVELRHEDVVIERVAGGAGTTGNETIGEKEIVIPLSREEPVVQKTTEVTGVVRARKTAERASETVEETVRKEDVEVDRDEKARTVSGGTTTSRGTGSTRRS